MGKQNKWSGERLESFITNETMTEHLHRYAIALELIAGKKVLDIACGEGYGTNLMSKIAAQVTGIDSDKNTIEKAKKKYTAGNIVFLAGSVLKIPAQNNSFDVITCFETLEHVTEHDEMLSELKRVLSPTGILLISTPDKKNYSDKTGGLNPFHKKELYEQEFKNLINRYFPHADFYRQNFYTGSVITNGMKIEIQTRYTGNFEKINTDAANDAVYWIGITSQNKIPEFPDSFFQHPETITQMLEKQAGLLKKTITYRTGNILLFPFKFIRSLFRK
jgi:ubiquinone/menaquinone biosynthesis C-methylase UbiE